jgi:capsular polysaccharide transport system ATP-binding protein
LAFALSMVVEFDCFLIDEIVAVGDSRFQEKCHEELFVKRADRARIIVSHNADYIRDHCNRAAVLFSGKHYPFDTDEAAYRIYTERLN